LRHKQPNTTAVREAYRKASLLGMDLDGLSDMNLVRSCATELRSVGNGKRAGFSASVCRRLRRLGVLNRRSLTLTESGLKLLKELEAEARTS
jgi:hypothetical protein